MLNLSLQDLKHNRRKCKHYLSLVSVGKIFTKSENIDLSICYRDMIKIYDKKIAKINKDNRLAKNNTIAIKKIMIIDAIIYKTEHDAFYLDDFLNHAKI